jgi:hypothetical protein
MKYPAFMKKIFRSIFPSYHDDIKIFVCYNRAWDFPKESIYVPIQSGKALSDYDLGILGDDTADNISLKNETFGEFTAWYWIWKNVNTIFPNGLRYIGLSHYRRFFSFNIDEPEIINLDIIPPMKKYEKKIFHILKKYQIILTKPTIFSRFLYKHYEECHYIQDYYIVKKVIHNLFPEYDNSFIHIMEETKQMSCYCMFISTMHFFTEYFEWLFAILFEMEKRINISVYNDYQKRVLAFLAERLLNVYVNHNKLNVSFKSVFFLHNYLPGIHYAKYFVIFVKGKLKSSYKRFVPKNVRIIISKLRGKV